MDPVAIISTVGATSQIVQSVSTTLYSFISSVKVVDQSLEALHVEVNGLHGVLDTIENTLKTSVIAQAKEAAALADGIWASIDHAIEDCQRTVTVLQNIVQSLGNSPSTSYKKVVKQIQLNLNAEDIRNVKARVQTHSFILQLTLQMAVLYSNLNQKILFLR